MLKSLDDILKLHYDIKKDFLITSIPPAVCNKMIDMTNEFLSTRTIMKLSNTLFDKDKLYNYEFIHGLDNTPSLIQIKDASKCINDVEEFTSIYEYKCQSPVLVELYALLKDCMNNNEFFIVTNIPKKYAINLFSELNLIGIKFKSRPEYSNFYIKIEYGLNKYGDMIGKIFDQNECEDYRFFDFLKYIQDIPMFEEITISQKNYHFNKIEVVKSAIIYFNTHKKSTRLVIKNIPNRADFDEICNILRSRNISIPYGWLFNKIGVFLIRDKNVTYISNEEYTKIYFTNDDVILDFNDEFFKIQDNILKKNNVDIDKILLDAANPNKNGRIYKSENFIFTDTSAFVIPGDLTADIMQHAACNVKKLKENLSKDFHIIHQEHKYEKTTISKPKEFKEIKIKYIKI